MERSWQGTVVLDLHGKNAYQARIAVDAALRRADRGVYRLRVIHGHNRGTVLRDLLSTYAAHEKVLQVAQYNAGTTDLILRDSTSHRRYEHYDKFISPCKSESNRIIVIPTDI